MPKKYVAEFVGTFVLSFVVLVALAFVGALPIAVPVIAGLTVALFVYTIGPISGAHLNPAVTLGLLSVKKIAPYDALNYIIAQVLGAFGAILVAKYFDIASSMSAGDFSLGVFLAEMLGTLFFGFGIASVVYGRTKDQMSGFVIGGSLTLGVLIAALSGASGILNPAVAIALSSFSIVYLFAPIIGMAIGFHVYKYIAH